MKNLKMKDMPQSELPSEKILEYGGDALSDAELLAIILRCGTKELSVLALSQQILNGLSPKGLIGLNYATEKALCQIPGIGKMRASQLLAVTEISRRISRESFKDKLSFHSPESIADYFMEDLRYLTKERVYALFMTANHAIIKKKLISEGSVNRSIANPREIFIEALKAEAVSIILIHNHPSGDPEPSEADVLLTTKLIKAGILMGIPVLDHIVIGDKSFVSLSERGLLYEV